MGVMASRRPSGSIGVLQRLDTRWRGQILPSCFAPRVTAALSPLRPCGKGCANIDEEVLGAHQDRYDLACVHTNMDGFDQFHDFERAAELNRRADVGRSAVLARELDSHRHAPRPKPGEGLTALVKRASQHGSGNADRILALLPHYPCTAWLHGSTFVPFTTMALLPLSQDIRARSFIECAV